MSIHYNCDSSFHLLVLTVLAAALQRRRWLLISFLLLHLLLSPLANGFLYCALIPKDFDRGYGCFVTEPTCPNENVTFWLYTR